MKGPDHTGGNMKARTLGPALMIVFGVVTLTSPVYSSTSAGVIDPCAVPGAGTTVPCCEPTAAAVVEPCDTVPESTASPTTGGEGSGAGIPDAGSNSATTIALGVSLVAGGAALIVTTRRRPKAAAQP